MTPPLTFDLADRRIEVHVEDEPWRSHVAEALRKARVEPGGVPALTIHVRGLSEGYEILVGERPVDQVPVEHLVTAVERTIVDHLIPLRPDVLWLHAGAARRDDGLVVLLAGAGGTGKSTLTIGLVERGWRYLSDDTVPVLAATLEALPFPRTPGARARRAEDGHRSFDDLAKQTFELQEFHVQRDPRPLSHLVFPRFGPDGPTDLRPLSKSAAAAALFCHCSRARDDRQRNIGVVGRIVRTLPALELPYSSAPDALDLIERLRAPS